MTTRAALRLYTVPETAEILRVSVPTLYRYIRGGKLKAVRVSNRKTLVAEEDLLAFVESHKTSEFELPAEEGANAYQRAFCASVESPEEA